MADSSVMVAQAKYREACQRWRDAMLRGANAEQVLDAGREVLLTGIRVLREEGTLDGSGLIGPNETLEDLERELHEIDRLARERAAPPPSSAPRAASRALGNATSAEPGAEPGVE
jgi:hypothetical protein